MAISLYDATVASYLQTLGAVSGYLERGFAHCVDNNIDPNEVMETRLFPDMNPFRFQLQSVAHHSLGAIEGVRRGVFSPPPAMDPLDYPAMQKVVADARTALSEVSREEIEALEGKDMKFQMRGVELPFTAENFLLSFSLPNFYFHAPTAYDILRQKGVPLGKRDFMGRLRMKSA